VSFSYSRDALGRIEGEDISNANYVWRPARLASDGSTAYAANAINQYTSVGTVSPTYDTAGNLTSDGTYTYTYDSQNLLKEVKKTINSVDVDVASYSYDALNRRSEKAVVAGAVTTRYLWGGVTNYAEMDGGGVVQRYFIYGGGIDTPVMVREYDGSKSYVHQSGKSSVFATTTDGGAAVAAAGTTAYTMDPWGEGTDASGSPFKFTARRIDDETGNYYYRNRYYHVGQGRFMSNDPIGYADGLNMYAYVQNDPVNNVDPMGLCTGSRITNSNGTCRSSGTSIPASSAGGCNGRCPITTSTREVPGDTSSSEESTTRRGPEDPTPTAGESTEWFGEEFNIKAPRFSFSFLFAQQGARLLVLRGIADLSGFDNPQRDVPFLYVQYQRDLARAKHLLNNPFVLSDGSIGEDHTLLFLAAGGPKALQLSWRVLVLAGNGIRSGALAAESALFRPGTWINSGGFLRFGMGKFNKGWVYRLSGESIGRIPGPIRRLLGATRDAKGDWKIDMPWTWRPFN